jgi:hypothetical protein
MYKRKKLPLTELWRITSAKELRKSPTTISEIYRIYSYLNIIEVSTARQLQNGTHQFVDRNFVRTRRYGNGYQKRKTNEKVYYTFHQNGYFRRKQDTFNYCGRAVQETYQLNPKVPYGQVHEYGFSRITKPFKNDLAKQMNWALYCILLYRTATW